MVDQSLIGKLEGLRDTLLDSRNPVCVLDDVLKIVRQHETDTAGKIPERGGVLPPITTDTLIGKLEVIDLALDKSIDVNDEYMDEAKSLLTKLIKEVQQREIRYNDRLDLEPARLAKACDTVREKGLNEKSTLEYVAAEAIREYLRHIFPNGNIMPQNDKKQQNVTDRELLNRLGEIQEYAGQFFGCRCDQEEDCAPGDCWPCRMVTIANMANPDDEELPMRELSEDSHKKGAREGWIRACVFYKDMDAEDPNSEYSAEMNKRWPII